jgi:hypothetical protein
MIFQMGARDGFIIVSSTITCISSVQNKRAPFMGRKNAGSITVSLRLVQKPIACDGLLGLLETSCFAS